MYLNKYIFSDDKGTIICIQGITEYHAKETAIHMYGLDRNSIKLYKKIN
jgi:hypothetical protein